MTTRRLSQNQREALDKVRAGRVQYGAENPAMARRAAARRGQSAVIHVWLIDGAPAYGQESRTYSSLEEHGLIVVRHDLIEHHRVPAATRTYRTVTGHETKVIPAHDEPTDPGWRAHVDPMPTFKVGDSVRHRRIDFTGTIWQIEGGPNRDLTEVYSPKHDQATWFKTVDLTITTTGGASVAVPCKWCATGHHMVRTDDFGPDQRASDGLRSCCRPCEAQRARQRWEARTPQRRKQRIAQQADYKRGQRKAKGTR